MSEEEEKTQSNIQASSILEEDSIPLDVTEASSNTESEGSDSESIDESDAGKEEQKAISSSLETESQSDEESYYKVRAIRKRDLKAISKQATVLKAPAKKQLKWTVEEHERFLLAVQKYGKNLPKIAEIVQTKT